MNSEQDLLQKLMVSKKIMDRHNEIPRNPNLVESPQISAPQLESFSVPNSTYNIPQEILSEVRPANVPKYENSQDKIMSSKLPDEIKRLMIEHPISQPDNMKGPTLSDDLVERAARLMGTQKQQIKEQQPQVHHQGQSTFDNKELRKMLREVVQEVLSENGLLVESISKSNDIFSFKVGKHVFEGKVTKIKKMV
jgi:hypothetical protein